MCSFLISGKMRQRGRTKPYGNGVLSHPNAPEKSFKPHPPVVERYRQQQEDELGKEIRTNRDILICAKAGPLHEHQRRSKPEIGLGIPKLWELAPS